MEKDAAVETLQEAQGEQEVAAALDAPAAMDIEEAAGRAAPPPAQVAQQEGPKKPEAAAVPAAQEEDAGEEEEEEKQQPEVAAAQARLNAQEEELQAELGLLRATLATQREDSDRLMAAWGQAQEALSASGAELDGVQKERRRLSLDVGRLTRELSSTRRRMPLLAHASEAAQAEADRLR